MYLRYFNALLISFFILVSCKNNDQYSHVFNKYLSETFALSIPNDSAYFILIPAGSCVGCYQYWIKNINQLQIKSNHNLFIIADNHSYSPDVFKLLPQGTKIYIDKKNKLSRLNIGIQSITLIKTYNKTIINIQSLTPQ